MFFDVQLYHVLLFYTEVDDDCPSGKCPAFIIDNNDNEIDDDDEDGKTIYLNHFYSTFYQYHNNPSLTWNLSPMLLGL